MVDVDAVVIVLHGHGAPPGDATQLAAELTRGTAVRGVGLDGPWRLDDGTLAWFDPMNLDGLDAAIAMIRDAIAAQRSAGARITLVGASQGAAAALAAVGPSGAAAVDGLVCWSGFAVEGPAHELDLDGLDGVEVLVIHGDADDVVPVWMAEDLASLATRSGASVTTTIIGGGGHGRTPDAIAEVASWLHKEHHA